MESFPLTAAAEKSGITDRMSVLRAVSKVIMNTPAKNGQVRVLGKLVWKAKATFAGNQLGIFNNIYLS